MATTSSGALKMLASCGAFMMRSAANATQIDIWSTPVAPMPTTLPSMSCSARIELTISSTMRSRFSSSTPFMTDAP